MFQYKVVDNKCQQLTLRIMNNHYTEIAFILDRSGSMQSCKDAAIEGFNHFLCEQQKVEGVAKLTLVLFDDEYLVPCRSVPVQEILPLDGQTFVPRNTTALLDAIGRTIDELGQSLSQLPEKDRPAQVIVAILTDGLENASRRYSWSDIGDWIKLQSETYKWTFLFLGANQDAIATAAQLSISAANAANYVDDAAGLHASHLAFSRRTSALRRKSMGRATADDLMDLAAPMSQILKEEDRKERGK
jgi:hypothetical protein